MTCEVWQRAQVKRERERGGKEKRGGRGNRYVSAMTHRCWVFIASGGREGGVGKEERGGGGQTVWEAAKAAS